MSGVNTETLTPVSPIFAEAAVENNPLESPLKEALPVSQTKPAEAKPVSKPRRSPFMCVTNPG